MSIQSKREQALFDSREILQIQMNIAYHTKMLTLFSEQLKSRSEDVHDALERIAWNKEEQPSHEGHDYQPTHDH